MVERAVDLLTEQLAERLEDQGIHLEMSDTARAFIARESFDPVYGRIGRSIIGGEIADGTRITIGLEDGKLAVRHGSGIGKVGDRDS